MCYKENDRLCLVEDAEGLAEFPEAGHHLLLDEVERHGDGGEAEHEVNDARDELDVALFEHLGAGHEIAEADRGQRDEAEVGAVQVRPLFPSGKHDRPEANVPANYIIINIKR